MKVRIVVIGDEILLGRVTDTNSGMLARMLDPEGWSVDGVEVCGDSGAAITAAVSRALSEADVVLTTGGLGPTRDDITKQVLMDIFGGKLRHSPEVMANVTHMMEARGLTVNSLTATQALVPDSCEVIQNPAGTAPVMLFRKEKKTLVAMPGVPAETQAVFPSAVLPRLLELYPDGAASRLHRTLIVEGIPESAVAMRLEQWENALPPELHLAYLPDAGIVRLRIDATGTDHQHLTRLIDKAHAEICCIISDHLLCDHEATPARQLLEILTERGLTVATAESCTGGNIARTITLTPGSSAAFRGSVVAYSNDVKTSLLGVDPAIIEQFGAVSIPVVEQMAIGAAHTCGTDFAIATSGIAGPGGATPDKSVGTVCISVAGPDGIVKSRAFRFHGNREQIIYRATQRALILAIRLILNH